MDGKKKISAIAERSFDSFSSPAKEIVRIISRSYCHDRSLRPNQPHIYRRSLQYDNTRLGRIYSECKTR